MKVAVACDHAGFALKATVVNKIKALGHEVLDCGCPDTQRVDFPDYAAKAGALLTGHRAERAVLICGSGIGMCIAANKIRGVYACVCHDAYSAHQGVEHDATANWVTSSRCCNVQSYTFCQPKKFLINSWCWGSSFHKVGSFSQNFLLKFKPSSLMIPSRIIPSAMGFAFIFI